MRENENTKRGFKVPEGYFESLDAKLSSRLNEGSKHGFKVPKDYFDGFELESRIKPESGKVFRLKGPVVRKLFWMSAAASILLFVGIKFSNSDGTNLDWENLEHAEISSWIESDLAEINAYDIAEAYPDVELTSSSLSTEDLNAYLNEIELDDLLYEN